MTEQQAVVHLVDDDVSVRDACQFVLEGYGYHVQYWSNGEQFFEAADLHAEGAVILDLRMPGLDGAEVHARLLEHASTLGVIILSAHGDIDSAVGAMKQGAVDFLQKPISGKELTEALKQALARSKVLQERRDLSQRTAQLSGREQEIAERVVLGRTNREIAAELHLAVRTVEVHRASLMRKLEADSVAQLVWMWQQGSQ